MKRDAEKRARRVSADGVRPTTSSSEFVAVPDGRVNAATMLGLQTTVGNASLSRLMSASTSMPRVRHPQAPVVSRMMDLQRDGTADIGPPTAQGKNDEDLSTARRESRWPDVARILDGFTDVDLRDRVQPPRLPAGDRAKTRAACPGSLNRVRAALLSVEYSEAVASNDLEAAAIAVNGFDDRGIAERMAALNPAIVPDFYEATVRAMAGVSRHRVLNGLRARYEQVSTDPLGTHALTVVQMMKDAGMPASSAVAYTRLQLGVRTSDNETGAPPDQAAIDHRLAGAMGMAATAKGIQPPQLTAGNLAHQLIGGIYQALNRMSFYDLPVAAYLARVANKYKLRGAAADLFTNVDMRPDIVDLPRMDVFEIKPANSEALAVAEMRDYVAMLNGLLVDAAAGFKPGSPANPGATGTLPFTDQG